MNTKRDETKDEAAAFVDWRSALFLPASNPRAIAKARVAGADLVILDLEDAVKPADKDSARDAAVEALKVPWPIPVAIRVNGAGTQEHARDVEAASRSNAAFVVIPRAASAPAVAQLSKSVGKPVLAMIETAAGVLAAPDIARVCAGLIAGTNDLRADVGIPGDSDRSNIATALQWIVLAARAAGIPAIDGVFNGLTNLEGLEAEARSGRALGFTGKSLIHPDQIAPCHRAFAPSAAEIAEAERLLAAYNGGAERFEDRMIERMHVESARLLLERASA